MAQALYCLGFEIGLENGQPVQFKADMKSDGSRWRFELVHPTLSERMGLVKLRVPIASVDIVSELAEHVDRHTNRLKVDIPRLSLKRRDKMIEFGPFDMRPGTFTEELWRKVEQRVRLHTDRPRDGDKPVTCVFARGAFEGSVRWPAPKISLLASTPRLPPYFRRLRFEPHIKELQSVLNHGQIGGFRVLEIGSGPVPVLSMIAARMGARAWAVEMEETLREHAVECVRDNGLEMVAQPKGLATYSFFGNPRKHDEPSVRVMPAMPSTSLRCGNPRAGATPKLLDGQRAHVIACIPGTELPSEDYWES
eukprot:371827-Amphidinium_carterae.1